MILLLIITARLTKMDREIKIILSIQWVSRFVEIGHGWAGWTNIQLVLSLRRKWMPRDKRKSHIAQKRDNFQYLPICYDLFMVHCK